MIDADLAKKRRPVPRSYRSRASAFSSILDLCAQKSPGPEGPGFVWLFAIELQGGADVGEQRHVSGALHGASDHPLFHRGGAGALAGEDLPVATDHLAQ